MLTRYILIFIHRIRNNHYKRIIPSVPYSSCETLGDEWRKKIIPNHTDYTGVVAQIVSEFEDEGSKRYFLSSGSIYVIEETK